MILLKIHDMMRTIPYGTIELVLHQGVVVQIETSEKFRLDVPSTRGVAGRFVD